jgi:hypothetical protein
MPKVTFAQLICRHNVTIVIFPPAAIMSSLRVCEVHPLPSSLPRSLSKTPSVREARSSKALGPSTLSKTLSTRSTRSMRSQASVGEAHPVSKTLGPSKAPSLPKVLSMRSTRSLRSQASTCSVTSMLAEAASMEAEESPGDKALGLTVLAPRADEVEHAAKDAAEEVPGMEDTAEEAMDTDEAGLSTSDEAVGDESTGSKEAAMGEAVTSDPETSDAATGSSATDAPPDAATPMGPAPIEIVISFDTTGSMAHLLDEVKNKVQEIIQRLFMDIPSMKICVMAHGDYCDEKVFYLLKKVDFTNDVGSLCQFVKDVGKTGGGDFEECYEWVLNQVRKLDWTPGTQRSLIMIGDAIPHEPDYHLNKDNLDWKTEADALYNELGVRVYAVQCHNANKAEKFWGELANRTHGRHLRLDQFSTIVDILMAICYREHSAEYFEVSNTMKTASNVG